jgi:hypothetical protein
MNDQPATSNLPALADIREQTVLSDLKKNYTIHEKYPVIPQYSILDQSEEYKTNRVKQLQKYFQYRYLHPSTKPFFFSPEDLQLLINDYFDTINETTLEIAKGNKTLHLKLYTIEGLIYHAGFVNRQHFYQYEKEIGYADIIKRARQRVVVYYESLLVTGLNPAGIIFAMKNIAEWRDKTEQDVNTTIKEIRVITNDTELADMINKL